ncbi:type II secretion system F family protein [Magnetospira sp. QH-2]|uniref:type II secretion system F family protein n=1 Tax=Magnetospira sp. (strain QH-2) TaxID=1288970 RepID=UPI0003E815E0|nr:type II secretion system F family protein [Magnetospira sp. QH-2]CCQ73348.1 Putative general secretory pathway component, cryptic [Magnetospira sp. QH-2]
MPTFSYRAWTADGGQVRGTLEAPDRKAALAALEARGESPVRLGQKGHPGKRTGGTGLRDAFVRDMARLVGAGVPVERALAFMEKNGVEKGLRPLAGRLRQKLHGGRPLSEALAEAGAPFDRMTVGLIRAGEASGALDRVLADLDNTLRQRRDTQGQLLTALIYPALLAVVSVVSVGLLMVFVVPQFQTLFRGAEAELPALTRAVFATSEFLREQARVLLGGLMIALVGALAAGRTPRLRQKLDRWLLALPLAGALVRDQISARVLGTMSILLEHGLTLPEALAIVRRGQINRAFEAALARAEADIGAGQRLADSLGRSGLLSPLALEAIRTGEESGTLIKLTAETARVLERDALQSAKRVVALIEPVLILGAGIGMGCVIVAVLLAVLSLNELAI